MPGFMLNRTPAVAVGPGRLSEIGADVTRLRDGPATALLIVDPGLVKLGMAAQAESSLAAAGHKVIRFDAFTSDPSEAQVVAGAERAWESKAQIVIGFGGGSALDAAKMIAVAAVSDRSLEDYRLAAVPLPQRRARLICIPTTAGTGSESTAVSVLAAADKTKFWYWGDPLKPDFVLLDPELTIGLPPAMTVATGLDALVHAMEAATDRNASAGNDLYAEAAIRLAVTYLPEALQRPESRDARVRMLLAACSAGAAIDNAGTALAHNIGHALGSLMPIHHGRAVALAMAATLPWVIEDNRAAFDRVAEAFGLKDAASLPSRFSDMLDELGLDRCLPQAVDARALAARMAAPENAAMRASTAREVRDADLEPLAEMVLDAVRQPSAVA